METIIAKSCQNILDIAVEHCGTMEAVIDIAFSNNISIIDTPSELVTNSGISDEEVASLFRNFFNKPATALSPEDVALCDTLDRIIDIATYEYTTIEPIEAADNYDIVVFRANQDLQDIAVEHTGSFDSVVELAFANNMSVTESYEPATIIVNVGILDKKAYSLFKNLTNKPASALSPEDIALCDELGPDPTSMGPFDYTFADTFDKQ